MRIAVDICMPEPKAPSTNANQLGLSVEDKVRDALECIESGYKSDVEWLMINRLYTSLQKAKQSPRVRNLRKMIEPVMAKYGYHKVATNALG